MNSSIQKAAEAIAKAEGILIGAGAGMSVDSGLPDFRGKEGFWRAYPAFRKKGYSFEEMANPAWFIQDPHQAWGFYGHRLNTYRFVAPHEGFEILKSWIDRKSERGFVFTSNVDGHFQKAGFSEEEVYECHGSIHWMQSISDSGGDVWTAEGTEIKVNAESFRAEGKLPMTGGGREVARPNILMFNDYMWNGDRYDKQRGRLGDWLKEVKGKRMVIIEMGAGKSVPTVRFNCERYAAKLNCPLIRINPRDADGPEGTISIWGPALESLSQIAELILE